MGSEVYVIETGKTYVLGGGSTWYSKADGDSFDCDCLDGIVQESTVWEELPAAARKKNLKK